MATPYSRRSKPRVDHSGWRKRHWLRMHKLLKTLERDMIRNILLATAAIAVATGSPAAAPQGQAANAAPATLPASNPFASPSTLPFGAPDSSKIRDADYLPALLSGMAEQKREVSEIANQSAPPTF